MTILRNILKNFQISIFNMFYLFRIDFEKHFEYLLEFSFYSKAFIDILSIC